MSRDVCPEAVLFDLDGVVAETEELKAQAHVLASTQHGGKVAIGVYEDVMGESFARVRDSFMAASGARATDEAYQASFTVAYRHLLRTELRAVPGVGDLIKALGQAGSRLALVSSSERWMVDEVLTQLGLANAFESCIADKDFREDKPSPEPYLAALKQLGVQPTRAIVIEDSPAGVESGTAAGLVVVVRRHRFNRRHDFDAALEVDTFAPAERMLPALTTLACRHERPSR